MDNFDKLNFRAKDKWYQIKDLDRRQREIEFNIIFSEDRELALAILEFNRKYTSDIRNYQLVRFWGPLLGGFLVLSICQNYFHFYPGAIMQFFSMVGVVILTVFFSFLREDLFPEPLEYGIKDYNVSVKSWLLFWILFITFPIGVLLEKDFRQVDSIAGLVVGFMAVLGAVFGSLFFAEAMGIIFFQKRRASR